MQQALGEHDYDEVIVAVGEHFVPEDVFDTDALETWAQENGFVKAE